MLVAVIAIGIGLYYKINSDKKVFFAYAINSGLLLAIVFNKSSKFFVPYWFRNSLAGYLGFLTFLGIFNFIKKNPIKDEKISPEEILHRIQYRYIKELAGIFK